MAEKEEVVESGGGKKKLIFIIIGALVLIGGGVGGALVFMGGGDEAVVASTEPVVEEKGESVYVDLKPAFTVNLSPDDPVNFLQVSISVHTYSEEVAQQVEKHSPLIRNNIMVLFGEQQSMDLRTPEGKEGLQKNALAVMQEVIDEYGNGGEIDNVFFTKFVMQ